MLRTDDAIIGYVLDSTDIFESIHPNYVTIISFIVNFVIYYVLMRSGCDNMSLLVIFALLGIRWFSDCLDGNIARKYHKTSKIGGILDTSADWIFIFIMFHYIVVKMGLPVETDYLYLLFVVYQIFGLNITNEHETLKKYTGSIKDFFAFFANNSSVTFAAFFAFVCLTY